MGTLANEKPTIRRKAAARLVRQFSQFSAVGVVGTIIHYGVMAVLVEPLHVHPVPGSAAGFLASAVVSYLLNYRITFSSSMQHHKALPRFLAVGTVGLGINSALVGVLTGQAALHWLAAQLVATSIVLCWNFAANRIWTFNH